MADTYYNEKKIYRLLKEVLEDVKTIDTKVDYVIQTLSDMRQYYRIEDLWGEGEKDI